MLAEGCWRTQWRGSQVYTDGSERRTIEGVGCRAGLLRIGSKRLREWGFSQQCEQQVFGPDPPIPAPGGFGACVNDGRSCGPGKLLKHGASPFRISRAPTGA